MSECWQSISMFGVVSPNWPFKEVKGELNKDVVVNMMTKIISKLLFIFPLDSPSGGKLYLSL